MDLLQTGLPVTLELDGGAPPLDCVITAVTPSSATLVGVTEPSSGLQDRLDAGSEGYLVLTHLPNVLGLRGAAIVTAQSRPLIEFALTEALGA